MSRNKRQRVEQWLREYQDILTILPLEKNLNFSRGTIYKFLKDGRKLTTQEIKVIDYYIQDMIAKYLE